MISTYVDVEMMREVTNHLIKESTQEWDIESAIRHETNAIS